MLVELLVENYAVIERVRVRFHAGLNLLTGETGSGKSIIVDALGLLFGGRASSDMIRSEAKRARISGIFELPPGAAFRALLDEAGIEVEEDEILIEREIQAGGKSRAFAGSRPISAALLRDLAPWLGDIHGQHEQQNLFHADAQREMLDAFAALAHQVGEVGEVHERWKACAVELNELERSEQERLRLADLWAFQRKEIEAAALKPAEDAGLENERRVLKNVARLQELASAAYDALYDSPESAVAQLKAALRRIEELGRIDESLAGLIETLKPAAIALDEMSHGLRDYLGGLEADPGRLEEVENRLAAIDRLKRKYGASVEEILAFLDEVRRRLESIETTGERRAVLQKEQARLAEVFRAAAADLTERRKQAARELAKRVEAELASLAMQRTVFQPEITPAPWSAEGADTVRFLLSPNVGEEPRALEKIASGGELSRVALALKTCTADTAWRGRHLRTLVFDEVDAGVGGSAAEAVGRRLKKLAASSQVLCVTHLAQIAGFADHHYVVEKRESNGRTVAAIEELDNPARTREIGRMLSGQRLTPEALKHAEQLIRMGARG
ncbi:MAG TPA: DNA repair protein RecN [Bryobacteraceae bacterium]|nr:DNA repair protein RecN [Bryobacteraceae bacterium]